MTAEYNIVVRNLLGTTQTIAIDFVGLAITKLLNAPDLAAVIFDGSSNNVQYMQQGYFLQIYRSDIENGINPTIEFEGTIARVVKSRSDITRYTVTALGLTALLASRIIAWKAGKSRRSNWISVPAETIMKDMYNYNFANGATTTNGRLLDGVVPGAAGVATSGSGVTLSIAAAYENLLTAIQKVADASDTYFSLTMPTPTTFQFNYYPSYYGTDRRSTVVLSVDNGTLAELEVDNNLIADFTAVLVGAEGDGEARRIGIRPATLPTGLLLRETFVDSRKKKKASITSLNNEANAILRRQERKRTIYRTKGVLQNASLRYGRDYFIGDLVYVADGGSKVTRVISSVNIEYTSEGEESINVEFIPN